MAERAASQAASLRFVDSVERFARAAAGDPSADAVGDRGSRARPAAVAPRQHLSRLSRELHLHHDPPLRGPQHRQGVLRAGDGGTRRALRHRRLHRGGDVGELRHPVLDLAPDRGRRHPARRHGRRDPLVPTRRGLSRPGDPRTRGVGPPLHQRHRIPRRDQRLQRRPGPPDRRVPLRHVPEVLLPRDAGHAPRGVLLVSDPPLAPRPRLHGGARGPGGGGRVRGERAPAQDDRVHDQRRLRRLRGGPSTPT